MDGADGVYPSSEDTYLLMDALLNDVDYIKQTIGLEPLCIEIGSGSGEVTHHVKSRLLPNAVVWATDVNTLAIAKTRTLVSSGVETLLADLFTCFVPRAAFDLVLFNPPYVPTDVDEMRRALRTRDISASWAGGPFGRVVIDRFVQTLPEFLNRTGNALAYIIALEENNPKEMMAEISKRDAKLQCRVYAQRNAGIESLYVLRITKLEAVKF